MIERTLIQWVRFNFSLLLVLGSSLLLEERLMADTVDEVLLIEADLEFGEYLAGECSACHNPKDDANLTSATSSAVPSIHGADQRSLVENLLAYRSGTLTNSTMQGVAGGLSNDEIAALAAFLASLK